MWALGQYLKGVLRTGVHDLKNSLNKFKWDTVLKQVAHGIYEYDPRCLPTPGLIQNGIIEKEFAGPMPMPIEGADVVFGSAWILA